MAQRRYKQRVKDSHAAMQQEVLTRAAELAALLRTNAALRARERVLQRAIEGSGVQLAVMARQLGGGVSDAPSDGGSSSSVDRLSHASPEVAAPTWLGAPPAPPAVAGLGAALGGRPGLAGAGPPERAPAGAHQLLPPLLSDPARVLERLCGAEPLMAAVPRELLEAIGSAFRRFVAAHRAAQACRGPGAEAAHAQALALFRTAHELVRTGNMACLLLRSQLRCTNFETMAFGSAPHGHWERVVAGAGGLAALSPEAQADLVEAWRLAGSSMAKLRAQQQALLRELAELAEDCAPAGGGLRPRAEERQLRYAELLAELQATCSQDAALANVCGWKLSSVVGAPILARAAASSWPFWLDAWGCTEVIAELVLEQLGGH